VCWPLGEPVGVSAGTCQMPANRGPQQEDELIQKLGLSSFWPNWLPLCPKGQPSYDMITQITSNSSLSLSLSLSTLCFRLKSSLFLAGDMRHHHSRRCSSSSIATFHRGPLYSTCFPTVHWCWRKNVRKSSGKVLISSTSFNLNWSKFSQLN